VSRVKIGGAEMGRVIEIGREEGYDAYELR
jgi:hypothetical protein